MMMVMMMQANDKCGTIHLRNVNFGEKIETNKRLRQPFYLLIKTWRYGGSVILKTCPCNEDPLTTHFYIVKLGFTGVYISFLFLL